MIIIDTVASCPRSTVNIAMPAGVEFTFTPAEYKAQNFGSFVTFRTCNPDEAKADLALIESRRNEPTEPIDQIIKRPKAQ